MAIEQHITKADNFFIGEDKKITFTVFELDGVTPKDVAALTLQWDVRKTDKAADPQKITKSTGSGTITVTGVFNLDPGINTQKVEIVLTDDDTNNLKPMTYRHSLKIMDAGGESILSFGNLVLQQATVR